MSGNRTGLLVMVGLCTGLVVHSVAVALGVAVIFQTSALAVTALKIVGAGYLGYLAYRAFTPGTGSLGGERGRSSSLFQMYLRGCARSRRSR
jgi:threonine/homoserine/homoserine lactone efflux protein